MFILSIFTTSVMGCEYKSKHTLVQGTEVTRTRDNVNIEKEDEVNPIDNKDEDKNMEIGDIEFNVSTPETPLELNKWGSAYKYSAKDKQYHEVGIKITNILRGEEVNDVVANYNEEDHEIRFINNNNELEYCMIEYDILIPDDFETPEYGINAKVDMNIKGTDNKIIDINGKHYFGLSTVRDISGADNNIKSGNIGHSRAIFQMVRDYHDYIIIIGAYNHDYLYIKGI